LGPNQGHWIAKRIIVQENNEEGDAIMTSALVTAKIGPDQHLGPRIRYVRFTE
jgi:hypothetical protein